MGRLDIGNCTIAVALRAVLLTGLVLALGPPVTDNIRFLVLVAAGFLALVLPLRATAWRYAAAAGLVALTFWVPSLMPRAAIEEGHNVFLDPGQPTVLERELPAPVFDLMQRQFRAQYPDPACSKKKKCWLEGKIPDSLFAFSVEGLWRSPAYSRVVDTIGFDSLATLRGGFVNDSGYDWHPGVSSLDRTSMPFFVMYELPAEVAGGALCWRGHLLWEGAEGGFEHLPQSDSACRTILEADAGRRVFGVSILKDAPLAMALELPRDLWIADLASLVLRLAGVLGVVLLCLEWPAGRAEFAVRFRRQAILLSLSLAFMVVYVLTRDLDFIFGGNPPIKATTDGLQYAGFIRDILIGLTEGDVMEMLRGGQDVFYFMPGIPYLRVFEKILFGDTNYLYAAVLLATPFVIWALAAVMVSARWAWWFAIAFILFPLLGPLGLWYYNYLHLGVEGGYAEPLAMTLFFGALWLIIRTLPGAPGRFLLPGFAASLMLAVAVLCRPNFGPGAAIIIAVVAWRLWRQRRLPEAVVAAAGFLPVLFMAWHNYYFGDVFILATTSADLSKTLRAPPSAYIAFATDLLDFTIDDRHFGLVDQWRMWTEGGLLLPLLLWLIYVAVRGKLSPDARLIAYAALAQHGVLLFWNAKSRFTYIAWALTIILLLPYFEKVTQAIARQWRRWRRPGSKVADA